MDKKKELRKQLLDERKKISAEDSGRWSLALCGHLEKWIEKESFSRILAFYAYRGEPDINSLIERLSIRLEIGLPRVIKDNEMVFIRYKKGDRLVKNRYGILEPADSSVVIPDKDTLILVPGLCIDGKGYRLGYGGGYYDKYLSTHSHATTVGVFFHRFFMESIPHDEFDRTISAMVTEQGIKQFDGK
ncbi:MAG: 5-formyltetrahydrofolate cyclo-ligase [Oligoflexales bacterium]|nr:5-formyltetrahydrofolate cyclo-ligase [Oligoflexales bacterium]